MTSNKTITDQKIMKNEIHKYVRDENGNPIGVIAAVKNPDPNIRFNLGWSKCCRRDTFIKKFGLKIALARAYDGQWKIENVPHCILPFIDPMRERASKYFQTSN